MTSFFYFYDLNILIPHQLFWKGIEGGMSKRGQVSISITPIFIISLTFPKIIVTFSEKRPKKSWFQVYEEDVPWEQW